MYYFLYLNDKMRRTISSGESHETSLRICIANKQRSDYKRSRRCITHILGESDVLAYLLYCAIKKNARTSDSHKYMLTASKI